MMDPRKIGQFLMGEWDKTSQPLKERASVLPLGQYEDGSVGLAWPGLLAAPAEGVANFGSQGYGENAVPYNSRMAFDAAGGAMTGGLGVGMAGGMVDNALGSAGGKLTQSASAPQGIRAYHGSPHDFDRFSLDKIGTGEGAQAYGHGLYFADSEDVAKGYREKLKKDNRLNSATDRFQNLEIDGKPLAQAYDIDAAYVDELKPLIASGDQNAIKNFLSQKAERWQGMTADPTYPFPDYAVGKSKAYQDLIARLDEGGTIRDGGAGRMYEVNIKAKPEDFLDWDKPLGEQSPKVKEALKVFKGNPEADKLWSLSGPLRGDLPGESAIRHLAKVLGGPDKVSDKLKEAGVAGVRYRDGSSRFGDQANYQNPNYNTVVFDDQLIDILRKYANAPTGAAIPLGMEGSEPDYGYGKRPDGTLKGRGFYGELQRPNGDVSTEISIGLDFGDGETEVPLLVPTLTADERNWLLTNEPEPGRIPQTIIDKAAEHAITRMQKGRSPFATAQETNDAYPAFMQRQLGMEGQEQDPALVEYLKAIGLY